VAGRAPWRFSDPRSRVALGRALLLSGADARQVLELFYDRAKRDDPESPAAFVAAASWRWRSTRLCLAAEA
jgi:hypothetical protein